MPQTMKTIGIIPARFGSSRFPGKPLALIKGKTLIQRTYENAKKCPHLDDLIVATDNQQIFDHVANFGGKAVITSSSCHTGTERLAEVIQKNERFSKFSIIVNIQGDEPLLEPAVIEKVIAELKNNEKASVSTAVVKIESEEEAISDSVNKCVIDNFGYALYFSRALIPSGHTKKWRPDVTYYKHLGIYGYRREFLLHYADLAPTPLQLTEDLEQLKVLEHGYHIKVAVVESASIGVDRPEDIKKIEKLL